MQSNMMAHAKGLHHNTVKASVLLQEANSLLTVALYKKGLKFQAGNKLFSVRLAAH